MRRDNDQGHSWPGFILILALLGLLIVTAGCANTDIDRAQLPTQYATLKLIEQSSDIEAADVIAHVERVRAIIQHDALVSTSALVEQVIAGIPMESLAPSDRLLLITLIEHSAVHLEDISLVSEDRHVSVLTLLGWIEQAARMAG